MTQMLDLPVSTSPLPSRPSSAAALLARVLEVLDRTHVPYCLPHGYANYHAEVEGDVDLLIPQRFLPGELARVLHTHRAEIGADIAQWFEDCAHFIVLAGRNADGSPLLLQLHVSSRYEMAGSVFFTSEQILESRRRLGALWVPAPDIEFSCVLVNRLSKGHVTEQHARRMSELYARDPAGCRTRIDRMLTPASAKRIAEAADSGNWDAVRNDLPMLREQLLSGAGATPAPGRMTGLVRKIRRWLRPRNGFHVVFLGPDGVGKSTTIEAFQHDLSLAFLHSIYLTFAPGLLPRKFAPPKPNGPHSLAPRSLAASLLKAAWWSVCYTGGYFASVYPTLARGGLVVNHRYLIDAIVDRKRYRYSGPVWLLKLIWAVAPKPDLVVLLDADAELIQRRKQEVPFQETARQVQAYRKVIGALPIGVIIDASQPREKVAAHVEWLVLEKMAQRTARQLGLKGDA